MIVALYLVMCAGAITFVAASAIRAVKYARQPLHLRWEVYPVPHEEPDLARHGGSYFERSEWWRSPRRVSLAGELRFMIPEILFLNALREVNRPLWLRSFPFHFGLYLLAGAAGLVLASAVATASGAVPTAGALIDGARWIFALMGTIGLVLAIAGAIGLLHRRLTDTELKSLTTPGDIINLVFFIAAFGLVGIGHVVRPAGSPGAFSVVMGLLSWDTTLGVAPLLGVGLAATAALAAYIPMTHMSHFVAKFFTYHRVRWDDAPAVGSRKIAEAMAAQLASRPHWSAAHVGADGSASWADIAAANPASEGKR